MSRIKFAGALLAVLVGCADPVENTNEAPGSDPPAGASDGPKGYSDPSADPPTCADAFVSGQTVFNFPMGTGKSGMQADVSIDQYGNVLLTKEQLFSSDFYGVLKWPATIGTPGGGGLIYQVQYATIATMDRDGNAYVTGPFSQPLDIGAGLMVPEGNVDVFVAKLDPAGNVVFSRALHQCGDGVSHIAVDRNGRIAVSGRAMGTIVLDANGHDAFSFGYEGDVAFDSHGNLVVAGKVSGEAYFGAGHRVTADSDGDGFVVKLDVDGHYLWSELFGGAGRQLVSAVAIDDSDNVGIVGQYDTDVQIAGHAYGSAGGGVFVAKLDADGALVFEHTDVSSAALRDVAFDVFDNMIISGDARAFDDATETNAFVASYDASGAGSFGWRIDSYHGSGSSLATDSCGNVWWWSSYDENHPAGLWQARLYKLAHPGKI